MKMNSLFLGRQFLFRCHAWKNTTRQCVRPTSFVLWSRSLSSEADLVVSILGPPNAGKSTLFNRLMCKQTNKTYRLSSEKKRRGKNQSKGRIGNTHKGRNLLEGGAIVSSVPGTTRDRRECIGRIGPTTFRLVDTAGVDGERIGHLLPKTKNPVDRQMMQQTLEAAKDADIILLLLDARVGLTSDFTETARWLRKVCNGKVVILANKLEGDAWAYNGSPVLDHLDEAARAGFGEAIPISAQHGEGMADVAILMEQLTREKRQRLGIETNKQTENNDDNEDTEKPLQLAILGRQNVGKSTLVNALLKKNRVISGPTPGLTRDAIAIQWSWNGRPVQLVDTAGIRKVSQRNHDDGIEDLAVRDALRAMKVADVAVLVLDAQARMLQRQELAIADAIVKEGRSLVVAANKMDLIVEEDYTQKDFADAVREQVEVRLPMLRQTPIVPMSSLTGDSVEELMPVVFDARDRWQRIISTGILNRWLEEVLAAQSPPMQPNGSATRIKYIMQTKARPPTFLLFCNTNKLPVSYLRYLTRNFQDTFEMFGMEVRMAIKHSANSNPFHDKSKLSRGGGVGLGGREARKKRLVKALKTTGGKVKRRRKGKARWR